MHRNIVHRPSLAAIISLFALFVALGGTSYAAVGCPGAATHCPSLTGTDIIDGTLSGRDIADKSLTARDFRGSVRGAAGPAGPQGQAGPAGIRGDLGPAGPPGLKGDMGPAGPKGDAGPVGAAGPVGPAGPVGETGAPGAPGAKGDKGDTGAAGIQGPKGDKGDTGAPGTPATALWAVVSDAGTLFRGGHVTSVIKVPCVALFCSDAGQFNVIFDRNVRSCAYIATTGSTGTGTGNMLGDANVAQLPSNVNGVLVWTRNADGGAEWHPFHLAVFC